MADDKLHLDGGSPGRVETLTSLRRILEAMRGEEGQTETFLPLHSYYKPYIKICQPLNGNKSKRYLFFMTKGIFLCTHI